MKSLSHAPIARCVTAVGLVFAGLFGTAAQAAPIASFTFQSSGGFVKDSATCDHNPSCGLTYSDPDGVYFTNLAWGNPNGESNPGHIQSNLEINHQVGSIQTNGTWTVTDEYLHTNYPLLAVGGHMNFVNVFGKLNVARPVGGDFTAGGTSPLLFDETNNTGTLATCTNQPVGGWPTGYSSGICPDVYLTIPLVGSGLLYADEMYEYYISFRFRPGAGAVVEDLVIDGNPYVRIFTKETNPGESFVYTEAQIVARAIPEPATLTLFGLGLIGAAVARKRANRA